MAILKCCKCGDGIGSGKSFIPIEPKGTPDRKWACTECASLEQRQQARNNLGEDNLELCRIFDKDFLVND